METSLRRRGLHTRAGLLVLFAVACTSIAAGQQGPTFRATTNIVTTDVIVRDGAGQFVPDLSIDEFRVYEDGVRQNITMFVPWIGGRALGNLASASSPASARTEGLVLPATTVKRDVSGRLFIVFIDDLHLQAHDTPHVRQLMRRVRDLLVHDNDLVGFVSTGPSAIQVDPVYDLGHRRFNDVIANVVGSAPKPDDIIEGAPTETTDGPLNLRYSAHVAFRTAYDLLNRMEGYQSRRKAFVYISAGYNFSPYTETRLQRIQDYYARPVDPSDNRDDGSTNMDDPDETFESRAYRRRTEFSEADLVNEIAQLTRAAQRANVTFYTVDPRGLIASDMDASVTAQISSKDIRDTLNTQLSTLRVLADETGGFAGVETNDFDAVIRRIDAETSAFYQVGYVSNNPDPTRVRRSITIEITRPGVAAPIYRSEYMLRRTPRR